MMSIMVAKNGPAEKAGSILNFFNTTGNKLPRVTDKVTIAARVIETISAG